MNHHAPSHHGPILTVPELELHPQPFELTGNHFVSLPTIDPGTGGIHSVNVLLRQLRGLLELASEPEYGVGRPLIEPLLRGAGHGDTQPRDGQQLREALWLPCMVWELESGATLELEIVPPPDERGFVYLLRLKAPPDRPWGGEIGVQGRWRFTRRVIFSAADLHGLNRVGFRQWLGGMYFEPMVSAPSAAMAITGGQPGMEVRVGRQGKLAPLADKEERGVVNGLELDYEAVYTVELAPGEIREFPFFVAFNLERDGALTTGVHLRRQGAAALKARALERLRSLRRSGPTPQLEILLNRNLLFNYFYAVGRPLDAPGIAPLTSRSPLYYVSAAFWERDSLLWSFPAILAVDPGLAREVLIEAFTRHVRFAGEHAHYIDGNSLYPGFELDQAAAYLIALGAYCETTGERDIQEEPVIARGLEHLLELLPRHRHANVALYRTFLLPSDDPAVYPYVTYDNVLLWRGLSILAGIRREEARQSEAERLEREALAIAEAVRERLVMERGGRSIFAWSSDLEGRFRFYDDPPGSLQLLAHYGFCDSSDPIYRATVEQLHREDNPMALKTPFPGLACDHHPTTPAFLALCADLLGIRQEAALEVLRRAPLDGGLACESYDPQTGEVRTGRHFATAAGLLAHALLRLPRRTHR
jgi:hypothetical protein